MTDQNYKPPKHPCITYLPSQGEIWVVHDNDPSIGERLTADQAISLGLALMDTGLHLKSVQKSLNQPTEKKS